jgi:hypothetical protein
MSPSSSRRSSLGGFAFTIASARNGVAAKTISWHPENGISKSDYGFNFDWHYELAEAHSLEEMVVQLKQFARRRDRMIVMGQPVAGLDLTRWHPRWWARPDATENTLMVTARWWVPVDVDSVLVPAPLGRADRLLDAGKYVRDTLLPEEFHGVRGVVAPSASTGLTSVDVARLRLFFMIDRPIPLEDLRRWARGAQVAGLPVDAAVVQPGQPIYVARPEFVGMVDPIMPSQYAQIIDGPNGDRVSLGVSRYDEVLVRVESVVREATDRAGTDWRSLADQIVGTDAGFCAPLTRVLGLAARGSDTEDAIADHLVALLRERADRGRQQAYDRRWLLSGVRRFRRQDANANARLQAAITDFRIEEIDDND